MHLFIDESGSFVPDAAKPSSWCVVAAFVVPESHRRPAEEALIRLKRRLQHHANDEIKLRDVGDEAKYHQFLAELARTEGTLYACAIDMHANSRAVIQNHLERQVEKLLEHLPKMRYADARAGMQDRADRFSRLSPQLYAQLVCQHKLLSLVLHQAIPYYVQRIPATLSRFRWRVDQKNKQNSLFDDSFRDYAAPLLQSMSIDEPMMFLDWADYRHFERFNYQDGPPAYLKDTYGLDVGDGFNITQVMREDFAFVDSASHLGVQIADLLVSGLRRVLRGGFADHSVAHAFGRLMVQSRRGQPPIELLTLERQAALDRSSPADIAIRWMNTATRAMIARRKQSARK